MSEARYKKGQAVFPSRKHYSSGGLRLINDVVWSEKLGWRYSERLFNENGSGGGYASYNNEDCYREPNTPEERLICNAIEYIFKCKALREELNFIEKQRRIALSAIEIAGVSHPVIEYNLEQPK